jgi:hypothetical protein
MDDDFSARSILVTEIVELSGDGRYLIGVGVWQWM